MGASRSAGDGRCWLAMETSLVRQPPLSTMPSTDADGLAAFKRQGAESRQSSGFKFELSKMVDLLRPVADQLLS